MNKLKFEIAYLKELSKKVKDQAVKAIFQSALIKLPEDDVTKYTMGHVILAMAPSYDEASVCEALQLHPSCADSLRTGANNLLADMAAAKNKHVYDKKRAEVKTTIENELAGKHQKVWMPHNDFEKRPVLVDGSPDTLARKFQEDCGEKDFVADNGRLYWSDKSNLWSVVDQDKDMYPILKPYSGALFNRPKVAKDGTIYAVPTGVINMSVSLVHNVYCSSMAQNKQDKFFASSPMGCAFNNGFVDVNGKLQPLTKAHKQTMKLDLDYVTTEVTEKDIPVFHKFLQTSLIPNEATEEIIKDANQKIDCLLEFGGCCIMNAFGESAKGRSNIQEALILVGEGSNGKSQFISLLANIIPEELRCSLTPGRMSDEYYLSDLAGKRLNACGDISNKELTDTGNLKAIIACEQVTARRIREATFTFLPSAGHIFSCNTLPRFNDLSHGFVRRFIVIEFPNHFDDASKDPQILAKMMKELPQIIKLMVTKAIKAITRGYLTKPELSNEKLKAEWRKDSDSVASFLSDEQVVRAPEGSVHSSWPNLDAIYKTYTKWCIDNGYKGLVTKREMIKRISSTWKIKTKVQKGITKLPIVLVQPDFSECEKGFTVN